MQMVRYYGWYSNSRAQRDGLPTGSNEAAAKWQLRGQRAKAAESVTGDTGDILIDDEDTPYRKLARMRWGALLKRVFEVNPLCCPKCGSEMKIISFLERRDQPDVVEKILRHCGLWDRPASRASPPEEPHQLDLELQYVDTDEFLMAL